MVIVGTLLITQVCYSSLSEQTQNPGAVIDALKAFEHSVKRTDHNKYFGADSMEELAEEDGEGDDSDKSRESSTIETGASETRTEEETTVQQPTEEDDKWNSMIDDSVSFSNYAFFCLYVR